MTFCTKKRGLTLVETVVSIGILSVVMLGFTLLFLRLWDLYGFTYETGVASLVASRGIEGMTENLRNARTSETGAYAIVTAEDNEFTFYTDYDSDNTAERLRYFAENQQLKLGIIEPDVSSVPATYDTGAEVVQTLANDVVNDVIINANECLEYSMSFSRDGTSSNPYASLGQSRNITTKGQTYFDVGGSTFDTVVDDEGWVMVASGNRSTNDSSYAQVSSLSEDSDDILTSSIMGTLTDMVEVRVEATNEASGDAYLPHDVVTTDENVITDILNFRTFGHEEADNAVWSGDGATRMQINGATTPLSNPLTLSPKVWLDGGDVNGDSTDPIGFSPSDLSPAVWLDGEDVNGDGSDFGYVTGRYVRVELSGDWLHFGELQVFDTSGSTNLALSGTASSSGTAWGGYNSAPIDGNTGGNQGGGDGIYHSGSSSGTQWWEVDLGSEQSIGDIVMWNRTDCCSGRIVGATVQVLDASRSIVITSDPLTSTTSQTIEKSIPVSTWHDKSGNDNDAIAIGTPTFSTTDSAIDFNTGNAFDLPDVEARSIFMVVEGFQGNPSNSTSTIGAMLGDDVSSSDYIFIRSDSNYDISMDGQTGRTGQYRKNGANDLVGGNVGSGPFSASETIVGIRYATTPADWAYLGRFKHSTNNYYALGQIKEVVMFQNELSDYNTEQIEGYLAHKWGLTGNLPTSHPYKTATPNPTLTTWTDKSGNNNDATLSQASYDASNDEVYIPTDGGALFSGSAISTGVIFAVMQKDASGDNYGRILQTTTGNNLFGSWGDYGNSIYIDGNPSQYSSGIASTGENDNLHLYILEYPTSSSLNFYAGSDLLLSDGSANSISGATWGTNIYGTYPSQSTDHMFNEILVFDTPLSSSDRDSVGAYLANRWGISTSYGGIDAGCTSDDLNNHLFYACANASGMVWSHLNGPIGYEKEEIVRDNDDNDLNLYVRAPFVSEAYTVVATKQPDDSFLGDDSITYTEAEIEGYNGLCTAADISEERPIFEYYDDFTEAIAVLGSGEEFAYDDIAPQALATPAAVADVRMVKVLLHVNPTPLQSPENLKIQSFVTVRNLSEFDNN